MSLEVFPAPALPLPGSVVNARSTISPILFADAFNPTGNGTADDTTPMQNALSAASTIAVGTGGVCKVVLTPGKSYAVSNLAPVPGVLIEGYGAQMPMPLLSGVGTASKSIIYGGTPSVPISASRFGIRGVTFQGNGADTQGAVLLRNSSDIFIEDCRFLNLGGFAVYISNCQRAAVRRNYVSGTVLNSTYNAIDFVMDLGCNTQPLTDIWATDNRVENFAHQGITVVCTGQITTPQTAPLNITISGNHLAANVNASAGIEIENNGAGIQAAKGITITHNVIDGAGTSTGILIQNDPVPPITDPTLNRQILIAHNTITNTGTQNAIGCSGSYAAIIENIIDTGAQGINVGPPTNATITVAADTVNTSATLSNVTGANANLAQNGNQISGAGIPTGSFLLSGAGTATWTISQNATATATQAALTVYPQAVSILVLGNQIHTSANVVANNTGINLNAVRASAVEHNVITFDPGSTGGNYGIQAANCGWVEIGANKIRYAPQDGVRTSTSNDIVIARNLIYNPAERAANAGGGETYGVRCFSYGASMVARDNEIYDDRAVHAMTHGIFGSGGTANTNTLGNHVVGFLTAATSGTTTITGV